MQEEYPHEEGEKTVQIMLAEFYHWGSDVKDEWLVFKHVPIAKIPEALAKVMTDSHWDNPNFIYTSILIDHQW